MSVVSMKQLLEAGVHFGHQTQKWNPKMKKYIFIKRNGIHILDLKQTVDAINDAYHFLKDVASRGEQILFVGTKKQAQDAVKASSDKAEVYFVNNRWLGGMLTNMKTIRQSIEKMEYYEEIVEDGSISSYTKLEAVRMKRVHDKIEKNLGGIRGLTQAPGAVFCVDIEHEAIAIHEARKLNIPIIAMVDTNSDPDLVDYVIPSNDDAIRAIHLISGIMANAVIEGKQSIGTGMEITDEAPAEEEVAVEAATPEVKAAPAPVVEVAPAPVVEETPAPVVEEAPATVVEETPAPVVEEAPAKVAKKAPAKVAKKAPAKAEVVKEVKKAKKVKEVKTPEAPVVTEAPAE